MTLKCQIKLSIIFLLSVVKWQFLRDKPKLEIALASSRLSLLSFHGNFVRVKVSLSAHCLTLPKEHQLACLQSKDPPKTIQW